MRILALTGVFALSALGQPALVRAVIARAEGSAFLDGRQMGPQQSPVPLLGNSIVHTDRGRVEIRLSGSDSLFLGENSSLRLDSSASLVEIIDGSVVVAAARAGLVVDCEQNLQLSASGVYRFDVHRAGEDRFCHVRVFQGAATVQLPSFLWTLTKGETAYLNHRCGDHTPKYEFDIFSLDAFDRWSQQAGVGAR